ncbi:MAG: Mrp/NBP35 family ATP-binding protein [Bacteroidetes bacterium]|nr:Mrp/NBP35 family ATP-binding protein [Bacteroidota bacterium]
MITEEKVLSALSHVDDPDLKKDLVSLGMIQQLKIDDKISFDLVLTTPACPMKDMMVNACKTAIRMMVDPNIPVEINVTSKVSSARSEDAVLPGVKNVIAVGSGKGGVGKSSVAVSLALALRQLGATVGLLDADIYGPSIPTMFGVKEAPPMILRDGKQWIVPIEKQGIKLLSIGFMAAPDQAIVWRGPMISSAFRQFVDDTEWGELDYLIIDLPPGTGDVQITLSQMVPLTGLVLVTTPQEVAMADARRAASMFKMPSIAKPILGVVENMSYFVPDDMPDKKYYIFGQGGGKRLAEETGIDFLGELPLIQDYMAMADEGRINADSEVFKPYLLLAAEVARRVSIVNSTAI